MQQVFSLHHDIHSREALDVTDLSSSDLNITAIGRWNPVEKLAN